MRENVVREFIEMSTAYAKDTAHVAQAVRNACRTNTASHDPCSKSDD
jgi:hypothetical protein